MQIEFKIQQKINLMINLVYFHLLLKEYLQSIEAFLTSKYKNK